MLTPSTWPPNGPTTVQNAIPALPYAQYANDDNVSAFFAAYNIYAQAYVTWFNALNLPVYSQSPDAGLQLDWVVTALYGYSRPGLPTSIGSLPLAPLNTFGPNQIPVNGYQPGVADTYTQTTDDTYRRLVTWFAYKGDGKVFNVRWLKRRIKRFLEGTNGRTFNNPLTYRISVAPTAPRHWTITIPHTLPDAALFEAAVLTGAIELPFEITWTVVLT